MTSLSKRHLLACLLAATSTQAFAWGWATGEGGYAPDYHRLAVSGGATLNPKETVLLQGEIGESVARNGAPVQETKATDYNLGVGYFPTALWDISLDSNLAYDSSQQRSGGVDLGLGLHRDLDWCKPSLTVSGGGNNYVITVAGVDQNVSSTRGGVAFGLGLSDYFSLGASGNFYNYNAAPNSSASASSTTLNPSDSGGFQPFLRPYLPAPRGSTVGQQSGSVRNPLIFGFPNRDWSAGLTLTLPVAGSTLTGDYTQVEDYNSGVWVKSVGASFRQEIGAEKNWAVKLGWTKAVESGADMPFFSGGLTMYFRPSKS